ncbi:hypothetical protein PHMEG_00028529 [Phytophthora megakarya]|uniref:Uncharacterized protein n=1 Tax=Phytophthora megakarya TaxID=4795 RepID=A0A225V4R6_9STRA|nr:hypothetical protein PHMEG_00028529 [Phytophthora megakarya]
MRAFRVTKVDLESSKSMLSKGPNALHEYVANTMEVAIVEIEDIRPSGLTQRNEDLHARLSADELKVVGRKRTRVEDADTTPTEENSKLRHTRCFGNGRLGQTKVKKKLGALRRDRDRIKQTLDHILAIHNGDPAFTTSSVTNSDCLPDPLIHDIIMLTRRRLWIRWPTLDGFISEFNEIALKFRRLTGNSKNHSGSFISEN